MLDIFKFELYKITKRRLFIFSPVIIIGAVTALLAASLSSAYSYDEKGNEVRGIAAVGYEREYAEKVSGELTPEKISEAAALYNDISADPDNLNEYGIIKDSVYIKNIYPYRRLISYMGQIYTPVGLPPDHSIIKTLTYKDCREFYIRRTEQIMGTLDMDYSYGNYSAAEKGAVMALNSEISEPYILSYAPGWEGIAENYFPFFVILTFVVFVNVSSVFSNEFQCGAAQIILSSKYGRTKIFTAKFMAAFLLSTLMFAAFTAIYILAFAACYGLEGGGADIQMLYLFSVYDLTLGEAFFEAALISYSAFIFVIFFTMMISVLCRNNFISVLLALSLFFMPAFLNYSKSSRLFNFIVDLFPVKALNTFEMFRHYKLYGFSDMLIRQPYFILALMPVLSVILIAAAKNIYSHLFYK